MSTHIAAGNYFPLRSVGQSLKAGWFPCRGRLTMAVRVQPVQVGGAPHSRPECVPPQPWLISHPKHVIMVLTGVTPRSVVGLMAPYLPGRGTQRLAVQGKKDLLPSQTSRTQIPLGSSAGDQPPPSFWPARCLLIVLNQPRVRSLPSARCSGWVCAVSFLRKRAPIF